jgi:hypothetical protein
VDGKELDTANASDTAERLKFLNAQLAAARAHELEVQIPSRVRSEFWAFLSGGQTVALHILELAGGTPSEKNWSHV